MDGSALNGDSRECPVNAVAVNSTHQRQRWDQEHGLSPEERRRQGRRGEKSTGLRLWETERKIVPAQQSSQKKSARTRRCGSCGNSHLHMHSLDTGWLLGFIASECEVTLFLWHLFPFDFHSWLVCKRQSFGRHSFGRHFLELLALATLRDMVEYDLASRASAPEYGEVK